MTYKVLVIDDSRFARKTIASVKRIIGGLATMDMSGRYPKEIMIIGSVKNSAARVGANSSAVA